MVYEFDRLLAVVAAAFDLAYKDARRGQAEAIHFLDCVVPEWRRIERARQGESKAIGQIGQLDEVTCNGDIPVGLPLEKVGNMDPELERMNKRNAKMEELRQVKTMVSDFGTEVAGIKYDHAALERWVALGGSEATFGKVNGRHFAGMTEAAQMLLVKEIEATNV